MPRWAIYGILGFILSVVGVLLIWTLIGIIFGVPLLLAGVILELSATVSFFIWLADRIIAADDRRHQQLVEMMIGIQAGTHRPQHQSPEPPGSGGPDSWAKQRRPDGNQPTPDKPPHSQNPGAASIGKATVAICAAASVAFYGWTFSLGWKIERNNLAQQASGPTVRPAAISPTPATVGQIDQAPAQPSPRPAIQPTRTALNEVMTGVMGSLLLRAQRSGLPPTVGLETWNQAPTLSYDGETVTLSGPGYKAAALWGTTRLLVKKGAATVLRKNGTLVVSCASGAVDLPLEPGFGDMEDYLLLPCTKETMVTMPAVQE
jgi:hypothetical protein